MNTDLYDEKYFHAAKKFMRDPKRLKELVDKIMSYHPGSVLDVGCGLGVVVYELRDRGVTAYGIDFAPDAKQFWANVPYLKVADAKEIPYDDGSFDLVFSSDFFEHIPDNELDKVYSEMKRVSRENVIARIAYERPLKHRQTLYHVTNKPKEWWEKRLPGIILI